MSRYDSLSTPNYPALAYPATSGVTVPTNQFPDASLSVIVVPLHVRAYTTPQSKTPVQEIDIMPIIDVNSGRAFGGKTTAHGSRDLPRVTLEGFIDTPCTEDGNHFNIPQVDVAGNKVTYADLVSMFYNGQLSLQTDGTWKTQEPLWFRDPYGRVYNSPRVIDFSGQYVEQVPGRTNYNATILV